MADVFISYARKDHDRAVLIRDRLEELGLTTFFDVDGLDGGDVFPDVLDREVKSAGAIVGVWSPHSLTRPWVKIECDIGKTRGVLVPVQIEPIADLDRPAAFWHIQFTDLTDFDGDVDHAGWLKFIRSLARTLDRPELIELESKALSETPESDEVDVREELEAMRAELEALRAERPHVHAPIPAPQSDPEDLATGQMSDEASAVPREPIPPPASTRGPAADTEAPAATEAPVVTEVKPPALPRPERSGGKGKTIFGLLATILISGGIFLGYTNWPKETQTGGSMPAPHPAKRSPEKPDATQASEETAQPKASEHAESDDGAYKAALRAGTLSAYDAYLEVPGNTLHRTEVSQAIAKYRGAVMRVQNALKDKDFLFGAADAVYGEPTKQALQAFSLKSGIRLEVDFERIDPEPIHSLAWKIEIWSPSGRTSYSDSSDRPQWAMGLTDQRLVLRADACLSGRVNSCNLLAVNYYHGSEVPQNYGYAAILFSRACDGGNMTSCNNLAVLYHYGLGMTKDDVEASRLYRKACDGGYAPACSTLTSLPN